MTDLPDGLHHVANGERVGGFTAVHTPGHVAYVHEELDAAFLGDLAVGWGEGLKPVGRVTSYDAGRARASARAVA